MISESVKAGSLCILGIVVPCYNEEEIIELSAKNLLSLLDDLKAREVIHTESFIVFIDDGSRDGTWKIIKDNIVREGLYIRAISLSKNYGHQYAVFAGIEQFHAHCDAIISIDADLQDDLRVIEKMINAYYNGIDTAYGVRRSRDSDTFFKRNTAKAFYRLMKFMGADLIYNHADFRMTSRRVNESLLNFQEYNLFLRGIFPVIGYFSCTIEYDRLSRTAGTTKYPLRKMLSFAWEGITSFTSYPLHLVFRIGMITFWICILMMCYVLFSFFNNQVVPGWSSTVLPLSFIGAVQLLCTGVLAEYLAKIYVEVKRRPRYFIKEHIGKINTTNSTRCVD